MRLLRENHNKEIVVVVLCNLDRIANPERFDQVGNCVSVADDECVAMCSAQFFRECPGVLRRKISGIDTKSHGRRRSRFLCPLELGRVDRGYICVSQNFSERFRPGSTGFGQVSVFCGVNFFSVTNNENGCLRVPRADEERKEKAAKEELFHDWRLYHQIRVCALERRRGRMSDPRGEKGRGEAKEGRR